MNSRTLVAELCLSVAVLMVMCLTAEADSPKPDAGKFTLVVNGKNMGTDTFRMLPEGCDSDVSITVGASPEVKFHQTLKFNKGRWSQVTTDAGGLNHFALDLNGDKSMLKISNQPASPVRLPAAIFPFGNSSPHLFAYVISAYDTKKGGEQKFDLMFSEGVGPSGPLVVKGVVKAPESVTRQVKGKSTAVTRYPLTITGPVGPISMEVLTDKDKHVLFWNVPIQRYTAVRDGFQDLAANAGNAQ